MFNFFKIIFLIFLFLPFSTSSASDKEDPKVDDLFVTKEGFIDNLTKNRRSAEMKYNQAMDMMKNGEDFEKGLTLLIELSEKEHLASKATLDAIKSQRPDLVKNVYQKINNEKIARSKASQKPKNENNNIKEDNKVISTPQISSSDLKEDEKNTPNKIEQEQRKTEENSNKKSKISQEKLIKHYSLIYEMKELTESPFRIRTSETVASLIMHANNGNKDAMYELGLMTYSGNMVEKDIVSSINYFKKACDLKSYKACNNAGYMYRFGIGGEQDLSLSQKYLLKGALNGDNYAIFNLATFYFYDGEIDNIKAYYFSKIALDKFKENSKENKKIIKIAKFINKKALKNMTFFQKKYLENYYPKALGKLLDSNFKNKKVWATPVSMPQNNGKNAVIKIKSITPLRKIDKKTKELFLKWQYPINPKDNLTLVHNVRNPPALNPNSAEAVYGMMYRYNVPYQISVVLIDKYSSITAKIGDTIIINVLGTIYKGDDDISSEKQTNIREQTKGLISNYSKRIPLNKPNEDYQDWLGYGYKLNHKGLSQIIYKDIKNEDNSFIVNVLVE